MADLKAGVPKVIVAFMVLQLVLLACQLVAVPLAEPYLGAGLLCRLVLVEVPLFLLKEEVDRVLPSLVEDHPFLEVGPCRDQLLAEEAVL